ncbi:magnesium-dependent phosphatase 1-like [Macrosteles quadrilineatus]|uniref:magnesium-dependent phosphatase 1-like n=1 Tax=Macrosteles quadrilineatus TaxID=74068 RepID=UPI0023E10255|nr:magnesium-dependent phosphatase 1-like [Macrosteles quadrilineatus]
MVCLTHCWSQQQYVLWKVFFVVFISFAFNSGWLASAEEDKKGKVERKQPDNPFLPAMIVFHLDHTLWPFTMEIMQHPLNRTGVKHQIKDKVGRLFNMYPDVYDILEELDQKWYKIGGLSADSDIRRVEETTDLFDIDKFFNGFETKPGNKTEQMLRLSERAKVPLENILYYDTNKLDLDDMKAINVTGVWVNLSGGLTYAHLEQGFKVFREQKSNTATAKP